MFSILFVSNYSGLIIDVIRIQKFGLYDHAGACPWGGGGGVWDLSPSPPLRLKKPKKGLY